MKQALVLIAFTLFFGCHEKTPNPSGITFEFGKEFELLENQKATNSDIETAEMNVKLDEFQHLGCKECSNHSVEIKLTLNKNDQKTAIKLQTGRVDIHALYPRKVDTLGYSFEFLDFILEGEQGSLDNKAKLVISQN